MGRVTRGRRLLALAGSAACVLAALFAVAALSPSREAGPCLVVNEPAHLPDVPEASGLAIGRRRPQVLWTHNDSGNATELFGISADGAVQGRLRLPFRTRDWEDISAAPCPRGHFQAEPRHCLYVGDIGDNEMTRKSVQVYVVPEPAAGATALTKADRQPMFTVTYADGAHNAEAMFVAAGYLFIVTKDRTGVVYRSSSPLGQSDAVTMQRITQLDLTGVTDAEASVGEESVAVRTSDDVVIYRTTDLLTGGKVPQGVRIPVSGLREPQGEGVALGDDGTLYLASEGRPLNRAGRLIALRCTVEQRPT